MTISRYKPYYAPSRMFPRIFVTILFGLLLKPRLNDVTIGFCERSCQQITRRRLSSTKPRLYTMRQLSIVLNYNEVCDPSLPIVADPIQLFATNA